MAAPSLVFLHPEVLPLSRIPAPVGAPNWSLLEGDPGEAHPGAQGGTAALGGPAWEVEQLGRRWRG